TIRIPRPLKRRADINTTATYRTGTSMSTWTCVSTTKIAHATIAIERILIVAGVKKGALIFIDPLQCVLEPLNEYFDKILPLHVVFGRRHQHADVPLTLTLLCARRERPRRRAAEQRDEVAAPHHSITSSARRRKDSGIFSPIALAVVILMTSSILVG